MSTLDSLRVILNTTKLQKTDPRLYQFLNSLLNDAIEIEGRVGVIEGEESSATSTVNQTLINQFLDLLGDGSSGDGDSLPIPGPQGPQGNTGAQGVTTVLSIPIQGIDGDQGEDAFPIPGPVGPTGSSPSYRGAQVTKAADQTAANYTAGSVIAWDSESYDTSGFHDNVTNNSRFTIPSGITKVNICGNLVLTAISADVWVLFNLLKGGTEAFMPGAGQITEVGVGSYYISFTQLGVPVTAGDYFECFLLIQTDTSVTVLANQSNFTIQVVE